MAIPSITLSVVVPAYNEEHRLPDTLRQLADYLGKSPWDWEIRVVDDGSTDGTAAVAESFRRTLPRLVLQQEPHRGKGAAVKAGLTRARGDYRFLCDADLSMPVGEIARFLPPVLEDFDVAVGSREGEGARRIGEPVGRHLVGRAFNKAIKALLLEGIEDTQCGFKMFTVHAVNTIFPRVTIEGWAFDIEALYVAQKHGLLIRQVPIQWHYREHSHLRLVRDGLAMWRELLLIRRRAARGAYDPPRDRPK